jgi:hypothetical protein
MIWVWQGNQGSANSNNIDALMVARKTTGCKLDGVYIQWGSRPLLKMRQQGLVKMSGK